MVTLRVSQQDIPLRRLEGRDLQWLITEETTGATRLSLAIMHCPAGSVVKPCHSHRDVEEVCLILEGEGQAWIDGQVLQFGDGDAVFFPANSMHMVRNTGDRVLRAVCVFAPPTSPESYELHEDVGFR